MRKQIGLFLIFATAAAQAPDARQRAEQAAAGPGRVPRELLGQQMARGGYAGAVRACSEAAQTVTDELGHERGLEIRRVSLKARNPKDQPDDWEAAKLRQWERACKPGAPPEEVFEVVEENGRRLARYLRPILVQPCAWDATARRRS